jgi:hypothetical protein
MPTVTPNYGWPVPLSTDYVKDGATAIEALGDAIDATVFGLPSAGLTLISSTTIGTTVSTVTVSGAFSATYDAYKIILTGGVASNDTQLQLKMGATTAGYYDARFGANFSGSTAGPFCTANGAIWTDVGVARTTDGSDAEIEIGNPFLAKNTYFSARRVSTNNAFQVLGYLADTTSYTAFTINPVAGTLTGGVIRVYGYKN